MRRRARYAARRPSRVVVAKRIASARLEEAGFVFGHARLGLRGTADGGVWLLVSMKVPDGDIEAARKVLR